jgi:type I restriction enzyme S subunit
MSDGEAWTIVERTTAVINGGTPRAGDQREDQRRIAEVLDTVDDAIRAAERVLDKLIVGRAGLRRDLVPHQPVDDVTEVELESVIDPDRPIVSGILLPGDLVDGGVPVIGVQDIEDGTISGRRSLLHTGRAIETRTARSRIAEGDLLFTIRGAVGQMAIVPASLDSANITRDTARLAPRGVDPSYLLAAMHAERFRRFVGVNTVGQAVKSINLRALRRSPVLLVPRERQAVVGRALDDADRLIEVESERLSVLRATRSGLASDLLSGRVKVMPMDWRT